jgi:hypothetical protein
VDGAAGTAHRPLLASTGSELVVLAAADGALQLWDASDCTCQGVIGRHESFVTSLSASGHLAASSCSRDMRLWDLDRRVCLYVVPIGLPLPSPGWCNFLGFWGGGAVWGLCGVLGLACVSGELLGVWRLQLRKLPGCESA